MKKIVFTLLVAFTVLTACEDNNDSANSSNPAMAFSKSDIFILLLLRLFFFLFGSFLFKKIKPFIKKAFLVYIFLFCIL